MQRWQKAAVAGVVAAGILWSSALGTLAQLLSRSQWEAGAQPAGKVIPDGSAAAPAQQVPRGPLTPGTKQANTAQPSPAEQPIPAAQPAPPVQLSEHSHPPSPPRGPNPPHPSVLVQQVDEELRQQLFDAVYQMLKRGGVPRQDMPREILHVTPIGTRRYRVHMAMVVGEGWFEVFWDGTAWQARGLNPPQSPPESQAPRR